MPNTRWHKTRFRIFVRFSEGSVYVHAGPGRPRGVQRGGPVSDRVGRVGRRVGRVGVRSAGGSDQIGRLSRLGQGGTGRGDLLSAERSGWAWDRHGVGHGPGMGNGSGRTWALGAGRAKSEILRNPTRSKNRAKTEMSRSAYCHQRGRRAILDAWEGSSPPHHQPPHRTRSMTDRQIRDLQAFAVELAKEGRHDAAREVLALIPRR